LAEAQASQDNSIIINAHINAYRFESLYSNIQQALVHFINAVTNILQTLFSVRNTVGYDTLKSTIALFVVIDPIGTVPLFIVLTEENSLNKRDI
jgi:hypothetical protein